jgi:hypothetical protein
MASLYVGDLHPEATEAMLYEKFSQVKIIRNNVKKCRRSFLIYYFIVYFKTKKNNA